MTRDYIEQTIELMDSFKASGIARMKLKTEDYSLELLRDSEAVVFGDPNGSGRSDAMKAASSVATDMSNSVGTGALAERTNSKGEGEVPGRDASGAAMAKEDTGIKVTAPMVGVFFGRPNPESEPYVSEGTKVTKGQVIGMIEAMKMFNEITAPCDGIIEEIGAADNDFVEFGKVLFSIATQ